MTFTALRPRDCGFGACNCSLEFLVVVYARCLYNSAHWFTFLHTCKLLNLRLPKPLLCRSDLLTSGSRDGPGYLPREDPRLDDRSRRLLRETDPLGPAYDRYVRNGLSSYGSSALNAGDLGGLGTGLGRSVGSGLAGSALDDQILMGRRVSVDAGLGGKGQGLGYKDSQLRNPFRRSDDHLPPDASNTLFVEGLPPKCTRREAAHIFRPFVGFKEVRLVNKEARNPGGEPLVLCFVDFDNPNCAATAMEALQGYKFDENERDSPSLKLQFARYPGPRGGGSSFGRDRDDYRRR